MTRRRLHPALVAVVVLLAGYCLLALSGVAVAGSPFGSQATTVHIDFPRAIGLYPGDDVRVLGVVAGRVTDVRPDVHHVRVTVELRDVALAADAVAVLRMKSLIGERYVELGPAWPGEGAALENGAVIGDDRARIPLELSEILAETGRLAREVDGDQIARLVSTLADAVQDQDQVIAQGLEDLATLGRVLDANADHLTEGLAHLEGVTTTLAARDEDLMELLQGTAVVSEALTAQEGALAAAITGLDGILGEVGDLAEKQGATIAAVFDHMDRVGRMLATHREDFATVVEQMPYFSYGYARAIQEEDGRYYVVNQPRGLLFLPSGPPLNAGPGGAGSPVPTISYEGSTLDPLVPEEVDASSGWQGPLLPSYRIGPDGAEEIEHDGSDDDGAGHPGDPCNGDDCDGEES